jgi:hypothetical protein
MGIGTQSYPNHITHVPLVIHPVTQIICYTVVLKVLKNFAPLNKDETRFFFNPFVHLTSGNKKPLENYGKKSITMFSATRNMVVECVWLNCHGLQEIYILT